MNLSKLTFDQKISLLQEIEKKCNRLANNALIRGNDAYQTILENSNSHLRINQRKWNDIMEDVRGWSDSCDMWETIDDKNILKTKPEWLAYCEKSGLCVNYDFSDCLA